jgi:hypothetical protein
VTHSASYVLQNMFAQSLQFRSLRSGIPGGHFLA